MAQWVCWTQVQESLQQNHALQDQHQQQQQAQQQQQQQVQQGLLQMPTALEGQMSLQQSADLHNQVSDIVQPITRIIMRWRHGYHHDQL